MKEQIKRAINLGCGEQGLEWMQKRTAGTLYLGLDERQLSTPYKNYIRGEATHLPLKDESIDTIYADYYFNPIGNTAIREFLTNPQELLKSKYPQKLHDWYRKDMYGNYDYAKKHLIQIREILRSHALKEIARVLAPDGTITIVDKPFNTKWLVEQAKNTTLLLPREGTFTTEDFRRSQSLRTLRIEKGEPATKIELRKTSELKKSA